MILLAVWKNIKWEKGKGTEILVKKIKIHVPLVKDIVDVTEEYNRDRRDLELTQEELLKGPII